jgi:hypothetical protein
LKEHISVSEHGFTWSRTFKYLASVLKLQSKSFNQLWILTLCMDLSFTQWKVLLHNIWIVNMKCIIMWKMFIKILTSVRNCIKHHLQPRTSYSSLILDDMDEKVVCHNLIISSNTLIEFLFLVKKHTFSSSRTHSS